MGNHFIMGYIAKDSFDLVELSIQDDLKSNKRIFSIIFSSAKDGVFSYRLSIYTPFMSIKFGHL